MNEGKLQTYSGIAFNVLEPTETDILLPDIAHALSNQSRFGGHLRKFYSVAQHCILVSSLIPRHRADLKLVGLLHDASEAYLIDVPTPVKRAMPIYGQIEDKLLNVIAKRFDFNPDLFLQVKPYDKKALEIEARHLMFPLNPIWKDYIEENESITGYMEKLLTPWEAEQEYLKVFYELLNNRING